MATKNHRALWDLTRGQRGRFVSAMLALAVGSLLLYVGPQIVRVAIDGILDHTNDPATLPRWIVRCAAALGAADHPQRALILCGCGVIVATLFAGIFMYLRSRLAAQASESIARDLRLRLYDHLQHCPVAYHDKSPTGDQVQRCTSDVDTVRMLFASQAVEIARSLTLLGIGIPLMFWMDWRLALVAVALLPVIVGGSVFFFGRVRGSFKRMDDAEGAMTATLQENLTGIRVVRAFARQDFECRRFGEKNAAHRDLWGRMFRVMSLYWASSDLMAIAQGALVLFVGAWRVHGGQMSLGTMVAFISYMNLYLWPVREMGRTLTELGKATVSIGRIQEILDTPREADTPNPPVDL